MSILSGASVSQLLAVMSVPRGARTARRLAAGRPGAERSAAVMCGFSLAFPRAQYAVGVGERKPLQPAFRVVPLPPVTCSGPGKRRARTSSA